MEIEIRSMTVEDYDQVHDLWKGIEGFAMQSLDDSKESIAVFLRRNPNLSIIAKEDEVIIGSILCGHDGRRAHFYHVCVKKEYRKLGIGERMVQTALKALMQEGISKVSLAAFVENELGNRFWKNLGWNFRMDINWYDYSLNLDNKITKNKRNGEL